MKENPRSGKPKEGQLLIEAMVSIGILIVAVVGGLTFLSKSLSLNRVVSDRFTGVYLAAEGIEVVKNLIDANFLKGNPWNLGFTRYACYEVWYNQLNMSESPEIDCEHDNTRPMRFDSATGKYDYSDSGAPTNSHRFVVITPIGPNELQVESRVRWVTRGGGEFDVFLEDHFYNWRIGQ